jgi:hypothetical protein
LCLLVVIGLIISLPSVVQAAVESFSVQAGEELVRAVDVAVEDRVQISFTVLGQNPDTLHFWMLFPNGTIMDYGETSQNTILFASDVQGRCELHFDNSNSSGTQLVTLNSEIEHYYFGIPQIPFILIVITVFLLVIVAGYIIMGKYAG